MFLTVKMFAAIQLFCCTAFPNIYHSPLKKYVDQWKTTFFLSANTAANAAILNKEEKPAIHVLNLAILNPRLMAAKVIEPLTHNGCLPELELLIKRMDGISTLKFIYPLQEKPQPTQRQSTNNLKNQPAEILLEAFNSMLVSINNYNPVQLIIKLLITAKDSLKTAGNFRLGDHYEAISLQPGGQLELWGNDLTDGYTLTKGREEIYKDNDTRAVEKLVIPWLLYYTNTYRKENGLDTLKYDACLLKAATYQTDYLFNESKKNHEFKLEHTQNPHSEWFKGESPSDRALAAGCTRYCGENALYTTVPTISLDKIKNRQILNLKAKKIARNMVYEQWHNSKGHRENMLTAGYTCMGVSVVIGKHYQDDAYINNSSERTSQKNIDSIGWIAFGIQVMAY